VNRVAGVVVTVKDIDADNVVSRVVDRDGDQAEERSRADNLQRHELAQVRARCRGATSRRAPCRAAAISDWQCQAAHKESRNAMTGAGLQRAARCERTVRAFDTDGVPRQPPTGARLLGRDRSPR
jgi:hypothetical protein